MVRFVHHILEKAKATLNIRGSSHVKKLGDDEDARDSIKIRKEGESISSKKKKRGKSPQHPPAGRPLRARKAWGHLPPVPEEGSPEENPRHFCNQVLPDEPLLAALSNAFTVKSLTVAPKVDGKDKDAKGRELRGGQSSQQVKDSGGKCCENTKGCTCSGKHCGSKTSVDSGKDGKVTDANNASLGSNNGRRECSEASLKKSSPKGIVEIEQNPGAFKITIDLQALTNPLSSEDKQPTASGKEQKSGLSEDYSRVSPNARSPTVSRRASHKHTVACDPKHLEKPLAKSCGYPDLVYKRPMQYVSQSENQRGTQYESSSLLCDNGFDNVQSWISRDSDYSLKMALGIIADSVEELDKSKKTYSSEDFIGPNKPEEKNSCYNLNPFSPAWEEDCVTNIDTAESESGLLTFRDILTSQDEFIKAGLASPTKEMSKLYGKLNLQGNNGPIEIVAKENAQTEDLPHSKKDLMVPRKSLDALPEEPAAKQTSNISTANLLKSLLSKDAKDSKAAGASLSFKQRPKSATLAPLQDTNVTQNSKPRAKSAYGGRGKKSPRSLRTSKNDDWNFTLSEILPRRCTFSCHEKALKQAGYNIRAMQRARRQSLISRKPRKPKKKKRKSLDRFEDNKDPSDTIETQVEALSRMSDSSSSQGEKILKSAHKGMKAFGESTTATALAFKMKSASKKQQEVDDYEKKSVHVNPQKLIQYLKMVRDNPEEYKLLQNSAAKIASDNGKVHVHHLVGLGRAYRRGHHNFGNPENIVIRAAYELGTKQLHPCCTKYDQIEKAKASLAKVTKKQLSSKGSAKNLVVPPAVLAAADPTSGSIPAAAAGGGGTGIGNGAAEEELSEMEKCRAEVEKWMGTLSTVQNVKARDMALKELGEDNRSIRKWWVSLKYCRYLRRPSAIDEYFIY